MATISKLLNATGYCSIDNDDVSIEIEYISFPTSDKNKKNRLFIKNSNQCYYLREGKCNKGKSCPIYQDAKTEEYFNI